ncbi:MAG: PepSY domain-containing protein [Acidobacteria bacterium]|nr:PepSY domain-containing protein [Acidobacteriota bacterium]
MGFSDRPQALWWRKALFQIHLWFGLFLGAYVILLCLSGSVLVFQQRMMNDAPHLGNDQVRCPLSYGDIAAIALKAHPQSTLDNIDMRSQNRRVVSIGLQSHTQTLVVYIDSLSGAIVGQESLQHKHPILVLAENLHNQLAAGARGATFNGLGGIILFVISVTGIVLWWPGKKHWKRSLNVKWNARWPRRNWDMHSAFGFWTFPLLAMWALSGAYFIFPKPFLRLLSYACPMPAMDQLASNWRPGQPVLPLDSLLHTAKLLYPQDRVAYIYMDTNRPGGVVKFFLSRDPSQPLTLEEDVVTLQPASAQVLANVSSAHWNLGERISTSIYSVHFGSFGGLPIEILWSILGLIPVLLTVTGYWMWWNRVLKKKWAALRASASAARPLKVRT